MSILVAYASKCGATAGIAERIAATLRAAGQESEARQVQDAGDLSDYDAFVIGSALYYGSWMKEATAFVRRNWVFLASRPVWLFSSGPIDAETTDEEGHDLREVAVPRQLAEFRETLEPRDHRVFFGRLDRGKLGLLDRLVASLPAFPGADGDFRDWAEIDAWAAGIAHALALLPASGRDGSGVTKIRG
jgi:menaquinone-dependent protoporphyrinogen oxidase